MRLFHYSGTAHLIGVPDYATVRNVALQRAMKMFTLVQNCMDIGNVPKGMVKVKKHFPHKEERDIPLYRLIN